MIAAFSSGMPPTSVYFRDGRGRLHTIERGGQERHRHLLAGVVIRATPRFFMMGSRYPKAHRAASQERSLECPKLWKNAGDAVTGRATFNKFGAQMAYFRQRRAALARCAPRLQCGS
jgi:hypothetical protein